MRDFRPILNILGLLLCIEAFALLIPMLFDLVNNNKDWKQFFFISCFTFLIGFGVIIFSETTIKFISNSMIKNVGLSLIPVALVMSIYVFFFFKFKANYKNSKI